jgi:cobalt/nickel transport system permease protein
MHADVFDRYHHGHSLLHHLDARVKVVVTVAFILYKVLLPDGAWPAFALAWIFLLAANVLSQLGPGFTFRRSFVALPFALAAITAIFSIPGHPLAEWHIGMLTLIPTDAGVLRFISILVRSWLSVQMAILLVAVTEFPELVHALSHLRVPAIITTIIAFLYRYLFVLTDEVMRLLRARQARSAAVPGSRSGGSIGWRAGVAGNMAGQLFLRSYERSDRIYNAMLARGYKGQFMAMHVLKIGARDWVIGLAATAALILMQIIGRL